MGKVQLGGHEPRPFAYNELGPVVVGGGVTSRRGHALIDELLLVEVSLQVACAAPLAHEVLSDGVGGVGVLLGVLGGKVAVAVGVGNAGGVRRGQLLGLVVVVESEFIAVHGCSTASGRLHLGHVLDAFRIRSK